MTQFAIICSIIILFSITQLINWMWRKVHPDEIGVGFAATIVAMVVSWACLYHIIIWTYPLIK